MRYEAFKVGTVSDKWLSQRLRLGMQAGMLPKIPTIALAIVMLVVAASGWAQICAGQLAPATPAAPGTPAAPPPWKAPAAPVQSGGDTSLASGLVAYWKLDDASGTSAADSIGSNTGTWNGTLGSQWTTGKIGGAGNFNGTNNYVDVGNSAAIKPQLPVTIAAWIYPTVLHTWNAIFANDAQAVRCVAACYKRGRGVAEHFR
jgi:hypothetical protein